MLSLQRIWCAVRYLRRGALDGHNRDTRQAATASRSGRHAKQSRRKLKCRSRRIMSSLIMTAGCATPAGGTERSTVARSDGLGEHADSGDSAMTVWYSRWLWSYRPRDVPEAYWSSIGWFRFICWSWGVLTLLTVVACAITWRAFEVPLFSILLYKLFSWGVSKSLRRRMLRQLESSDFLLCVSCGYNLRGLNAERCPECGSVAKPEDVRQAWRRWAERRWSW